MKELQQQKENLLLTEPCSKLMAQYSIPCILSLVTAALYNICDQIFIANTPALGSWGNAANTVVFPLTVIALAFAVFIGDGACARISLLTGQKEQKQAEMCAGNALIAAVAFGLIIPVVYLLLFNPLLNAFGASANETTLLFSRQYFIWIIMGIPFYVIGQSLNPIIRADGSPRFAMMAAMAGAVLNIILDPVFLFVFGMGMAGAAIATILGQILTFGISLWYFCHLKTLKLEKKDFKPDWTVLQSIFALGMTSLLAQISLVASMAAVQRMVVIEQQYNPIFAQAQYSQIPLAVLGIVMKFFQIVISISIGLAAGLIPVAGANMGACRHGRVWHLFLLLMTAEFSVGLAALVIVELFPQSIMYLFGAAEESRFYMEFALKSFRIYLCLMPLAVLNKGCFIYLQALGKGKESTAIAFCREVVFGVGLPIVMGVYMGLDGILFSFPAADFLTFLIALAVICQIRKELTVSCRKNEPLSQSC